MKLLEVQRLMILRNMLRRHGSAADHEQVHTGIEHSRIVLLRALRGKGTCHGYPRIADLVESFNNEFGLDWLRIGLLQIRRGIVGSNEAIFSRIGSGFSYRVHRPSKSSTPTVPSLPMAMAVCGLVTESIGAPITGMSKFISIHLPRGRHVPADRGCDGRGRWICRPKP